MTRFGFFILTVLLCACDTKRSPSGDAITDSGNNAGHADAAAGEDGNKAVQDAGCLNARPLYPKRTLWIGGRLFATVTQVSPRSSLT
jgi:hypothetical protein